MMYSQQMLLSFSPEVIKCSVQNRWSQLGSYQYVNVVLTFHYIRHYFKFNVFHYLQRLQVLEKFGSNFVKCRIKIWWQKSNDYSELIAGELQNRFGVKYGCSLKNGRKFKTRIYSVAYMIEMGNARDWRFLIAPCRCQHRCSITTVRIWNLELIVDKSTFSFGTYNRTHYVKFNSYRKKYRSGF